MNQMDKKGNQIILSAKIAAIASFGISLLHLVGFGGWLWVFIRYGEVYSRYLSGYRFAARLILFLTLFVLFLLIGMMFLSSRIKNIGICALILSFAVGLLYVNSLVGDIILHRFFKGIQRFGFYAFYPSLYVSLVLFVLSVFCFKRKKVDRIKAWFLGILFLIWFFVPWASPVIDRIIQWSRGSRFVSWSYDLEIMGSFFLPHRILFDYEAKTVVWVLWACILLLLLFLFFIFGYRAVCLMPNNTERRKRFGKPVALESKTVPVKYDANELAKLKQLLDAGIISNEEYMQGQNVLSERGNQS